MESKSQMTENEVNSLAIEDAFTFYASNYSPINSNPKKEKLDSDLELYFELHYKVATQKIKNWIAPH